MKWLDNFADDLVERKMSPGMVQHYQRMVKESPYHSCSECETTIGKYPGRYPRHCPNCGADMSNQDGYPRKELKGITDFPVDSMNSIVDSGRDYKKEYANYHGTSDQIKNRSTRNQARRKMELEAGDEREVDHSKPLSQGGTNHGNNLKVVSRAQNRSKGAKYRATSLKERVELWNSLEELCEAAHAYGNHQMIPWSPNGRVVCLEAVEGGQALFSIYGPFQETAGKVISTQSIRLDALSEGVLMEAVENAWGELDSFTRIPEKTILEHMAAGAPVAMVTLRGLKDEDVGENSLLATPNTSSYQNPSATLPIGGPGSGRADKAPTKEDNGSSDMSSKHIDGEPGGDVKTIKTFKPMNKIESGLSELLGGDNQGPSFSGTQSGEPVGLGVSYRDGTPPPKDTEDPDESTVDDFSGPTVPSWKQAREHMVRSGLPAPGDDYGQGASVTASKKKREQLGDMGGYAGATPTDEGAVGHQIGQIDKSKQLALLMKNEGHRDTTSSIHKALLSVWKKGQKSSENPKGAVRVVTDKQLRNAAEKNDISVADLWKVDDETWGVSKFGSRWFVTQRSMLKNESTATWYHHEAPRYLEAEGTGDIHGGSAHDNGTEGTKNYTAAVAICIKDRKDVLIGKANTDDDRDGMWVFPGGGIDKEDGHDPVAAAIRECYEEMGVRVTSTGTVINHPDKPEVAFVVCEYVQGNITPNAEFHEGMWMPAAARHDFPGLYPANKAVLEQVPPQMLHEASEPTLEEMILSDGDMDAMYHAVFGEGLSTTYKIGGRKANAVGKKREITGGSAAPPPDRAKPGTSMKAPEKQKMINGDIKGSEKQQLSDPGGEDGGMEVRKAAQAQQAKQAKETGAASPTGKPGAQGPMVQAQTPAKGNGKPPVGKNGEKPPAGKAPPAKAAGNGKPPVAPAAQAQKPPVNGNGQDLSKVVTALKQTVDKLVKATTTGQNGQQAAPGAQNGAQPVPGNVQPQPAPAPAQGQPVAQNGAPVPGQQPQQPGQPQPGQPMDPNQPSALQQAVNGADGAAQPGAQPGTGQQPDQGAQKTVQLVLPPEKADQAMQWLQAMGLQNVSTEGGKVLVGIGSPEEMAVVQRTASAFGLELNGTMIPATEPMAGSSA